MQYFSNFFIILTTAQINESISWIEILNLVISGISLATTFFLTVLSYRLTKKINHGQNIIAVTTSYRQKQLELIQKYGQQILIFSNIELLSKKNECLKELISATEGITLILHWHFKKDRQLIILSNEIIKIVEKDEIDYNLLENHRNLFRILIDLHTSSDWYRIKEETKGINTSTDLWEKRYEKNIKEFQSEIDELISKCGFNNDFNIDSHTINGEPGSIKAYSRNHNFKI